ncbi:hypothetical protein HK100_012804 [Physocladia obscura]|uniref:NAD-dependent epimerase/dehydratase domain-containing protein n=1 Tax=Physocladia obscura TaxID=109957 RepID=A0AAD5T560_9FUNG|nr:hypothetical protein HK100_012804 [Physocladia obscura]
MVLVLVTGVTGFVASHTVRQLLSIDGPGEPIKVRGTVRGLTSAKRDLIVKTLAPSGKEGQLELVEVDLLDGADKWAAAVAGCELVVHIASPYSLRPPRHASDMIEPAVRGTRAVLEACAAPPSAVRRVVVTSSIVAVSSGRLAEYSAVRPSAASPSGVLVVSRNTVFGPADWPDWPRVVDVYEQSKTLAERAAWDFMLRPDLPHRFELCSVLPGYILGPYLLPNFGSSIELVKSLLNREYPGLPDPCVISVVDVRDVASAHIAAMLSDTDVSGKRFIVSPHSVSLKKASSILSEEFGKFGYKTPSISLPEFVLKLIALFDSNAAAIVTHLHTVVQYDCSEAENVLKIKWTNLADSLNDMGYSLIKFGVVKKKPAFVPRD